MREVAVWAVKRISSASTLRGWRSVIILESNTRRENYLPPIFTDRFMNCLPLKVNALQSFGTSVCSPGNTLSYPDDFRFQWAGWGNLTSKAFYWKKKPNNKLCYCSLFEVIIISSVTPMGELKLVTSWTHLSDCAGQLWLVVHPCCLLAVTV